MTLLVASCSKPEEVISRGVAQANQNLDAGKVVEAIGILEKLDRQHPNQATVLEVLGFAYSRIGRNGDAAASFAAAARLDPNYGSLRLLAAEAFVQDGALERAAEQHRMYLGQFPAEYQSRQKLGEIEERLGNPLRATDAYLECYRLHPSSEVAFRLGRIFRQLNNAPQASAWFEAVIKHGESHVDQALLGLLELELAARNFSGAARTLHQLDSNYPGVLDASPLATARADLAKWRDTQKAIDAARAEQERVAEELAETRRQQQAELEALRNPPPANATPTIVETSPPPPPAPATPEPATPVVASGSEEQIATNEAPVTPTIAETPPVAEPELPPAPPSPPASPELLAAWEKKDAGDLDGAIAVLWEALSRNDRQVQLWLELGDCYRRLGKTGDAEACLLEAGRRAPDSLEVETAYLNLVRETQPISVYLARVEAARQKFPANASLAYICAHELAAAEGETVRAIKAYEDFLLLAGPDDPRREEAISFLARVNRR